MADKPKCYRCGKEGGWLTAYYTCQAGHCSAQGVPVCSGCLAEMGHLKVFGGMKCPACKVGHMKSVS